MNKTSKSSIRLEGIVKGDLLPRDCSSLKKINCNDECRWEEGKSGYLSYVGLGKKSDSVCVELSKDQLAEKLYDSYCSGDEKIENIIDILKNFDISKKTIEKYKKEGNLCDLLDLTIKQLKENLDKINKSKSWFSSIGISSFILSNLITFMVGRLSSGESFMNVINYGVEFLTKSGVYGYSAAFVFCLGIFYYAVLPLFKKIFYYLKTIYNTTKGSYGAFREGGFGGVISNMGMNILSQSLQGFASELSGGPNGPISVGDIDMDGDPFADIFKQFAGNQGDSDIQSMLEQFTNGKMTAVMDSKQKKFEDYEEEFEQIENEKLKKSGFNKGVNIDSKDILESANIKKFEDKIKVSEDVDEETINILRNTYSLSILCSYNDSKLTQKLADRALYIKNNVYKNNKNYKCKAAFCLTRPIPTKINVLLKIPKILIELDRKIINEINEKLKIVKNTERYERKKKDFEKELKFAVIAQNRIEELGEEFYNKTPIKIAQEMLTGYNIKQTFETISNISPTRNKVNINKSLIFAHKYLKGKMNISTETYLTFTIGNKIFVLKGNTRIEALRMIDDNITVETVNIYLEKETKKDYNENELVEEIEKLYSDLLDIPGFAVDKD